MASAQTQPLKRGVEVSNKLDPDATLVRCVHEPGLLRPLRVRRRAEADDRPIGPEAGTCACTIRVVDGSAGGGKLEHAAPLRCRSPSGTPSSTPGCGPGGRRPAWPAVWRAGGGGVGRRERRRRSRAHVVPATPRGRDVLLKLLALRWTSDELEVRLVKKHHPVTHSAPRGAFSRLRPVPRGRGPPPPPPRVSRRGRPPADGSPSPTRNRRRNRSGRAHDLAGRDARQARHTCRGPSAADLCRLVTSGL